MNRAGLKDDGAKELPAVVPGPVRVVGRVVLWVFLVVVLARGVADILGSPAPSTSSSKAVGVAEFPGDEARAFAVRFARAYLTSSGEDSQRALRPYLATELGDHAAAGGLRRGPGARVAEAMVAREASLGGSRALITVAVLLVDGRSRYLTVPLGRDSRGGLAVSDLPALSAPPPLGKVDDVGVRAPLSGPDSEAVSDVVERFLRGYLAGSPLRELAYYLAPRSRVTQMPRGLRLVAFDGLDQLGSDEGSDRRVVASVRVRDAYTRGEFRMRYRLRLVRRGRWYVAAVEGGPRA